MFSKTTRFEILLEAVPDAFTGMELCGRQRDGTEFPVTMNLSHSDTGDVLLDHGGA
jgi:hypothetical protein